MNPIVKLTILLILLTAKCLGQSKDATLFFKDGDSISGYGQIKNNRIKFRLTLDQKGDYWNYEMVDKIIFGSYLDLKTYQYIQINKESKPRLLELVTDGELALYRDKKSSYTNFRNSPISPIDKLNLIEIRLAQKVTKVYNYLFKKGDDYPSCLNCGIFNRWRKRTIDFLIDCNGLVEKIDSGEYREIHLEDIVNYYNDFCTEL